MNGPLRNKQGCWTCRLRKKKCDERHPQCSTCESLNITCYGYGPRPEWMNGGEKEKAIANTIKETIKHKSRRKGRLGTSLTQLHDRYRSQKILRPAPEAKVSPTEPASHSDGGTNHEPVTTTQDSSSPDTMENSSPESLPHFSNCVGPDRTWQIPSLSHSEAGLLMHFMDTVFPLQYPLYKPSLAEGGRGWLLSLLMRTKPLFHASMGLSAYHRETMLLAESRNCRCLKGIAEQEQHLEKCLNEFQESLQAVSQWLKQTCPKDGLGLLATSVQLIFFDLFAGHGETWQIHLNAATSFFQQGFGKHRQILEQMGSNPNAPEPLAFAELRFPGEDLALFTFITGVVVWLDILSSITMGISPRLLGFYPSIIPSDGPTKLERIMGCENWAMNLIGQVSALHEYKTQALQSGSFNVIDFQQKALELRKNMQQSLTANFLELLVVSDTSPSATYGTIPTPPKVTTRIFALAGSIYLRMVVSGLDDSVDLNANLDEVMTILRTKIRTDIMHALIFPIYIVGCAARPQDEDFFRSVFSSHPVLDPSLEHRGKLMTLLEETWQMRQNSTCCWTWQENIRLSHHNVLLI